jgi:hypothetical protein
MQVRDPIVSVLLVFAAMTAWAGAVEPEQVNPSAGTFAGLRAKSTLLVSGFGERLDAGHDWVYRRLQGWLEGLDTRFAGGDGAPILVPLSPLRLGFDSEYIHSQSGWAYSLRPDLDATLRLPNLERRLRIFITSTDLAESPGDPATERNPVRAGVRFAPRAHIDFDFGVQARLRGTAFAALKWAYDFDAGAVHVYPFDKAYAESGLGIGASGGFSLAGKDGVLHGCPDRAKQATSPCAVVHIDSPQPAEAAPSPYRSKELSGP